MAGLTNFQMNLFFVALTTFLGISAVVIAIIILLKIWCRSCSDSPPTSFMEEGSCKCPFTTNVACDSIEFARGVIMSSTARSDTLQRGANDDSYAVMFSRGGSQSYVHLSDTSFKSACT